MGKPKNKKRPKPSGGFSSNSNSKFKLNSNHATHDYKSNSNSNNKRGHINNNKNNSNSNINNKKNKVSSNISSSSSSISTTTTGQRSQSHQQQRRPKRHGMIHARGIAHIANLLSPRPIRRSRIIVNTNATQISKDSETTDRKSKSAASSQNHLKPKHDHDGMNGIKNRKDPTNSNTQQTKMTMKLKPISIETKKIGGSSHDVRRNGKKRSRENSNSVNDKRRKMESTCSTNTGIIGTGTTIDGAKAKSVESSSTIRTTNILRRRTSTQSMMPRGKFSFLNQHLKKDENAALPVSGNGFKTGGGGGFMALNQHLSMEKKSKSTTATSTTKTQESVKSRVAATKEQKQKQDSTTLKKVSTSVANDANDVRSSINMNTNTKKGSSGNEKYNNIAHGKLEKAQTFRSDGENASASHSTDTDTGVDRNATVDGTKAKSVESSSIIRTTNILRTRISTSTQSIMPRGKFSILNQHLKKDENAALFGTESKTGGGGFMSLNQHLLMEKKPKSTATKLQEFSKNSSPRATKEQKQDTAILRKDVASVVNDTKKGSSTMEKTYNIAGLGTLEKAQTIGLDNKNTSAADESNIAHLDCRNTVDMTDSIRTSKDDEKDEVLRAKQVDWHKCAKSFGTIKERKQDCETLRQDATTVAYIAKSNMKKGSSFNGKDSNSIAHGVGKLDKSETFISENTDIPSFSCTSDSMSDDSNVKLLVDTKVQVESKNKGKRTTDTKREDEKKTTMTTAKGAGNLTQYDVKSSVRKQDELQTSSLNEESNEATRCTEKSRYIPHRKLDSDETSVNIDNNIMPYSTHSARAVDNSMPTPITVSNLGSFSKGVVPARQRDAKNMNASKKSRIIHFNEAESHEVPDQDKCQTNLSKKDSEGSAVVYPMIEMEESVVILSGTGTSELESGKSKKSDCKQHKSFPLEILSGTGTSGLESGKSKKSDCKQHKSFPLENLQNCPKSSTMTHLPISTNEDNMRGLDSVKKNNEAITIDENMSVPMSMEVGAQSSTEPNTNLDNDGIHYSRSEGFHETVISKEGTPSIAVSMKNCAHSVKPQDSKEDNLFSSSEPSTCTDFNRVISDKNFFEGKNDNFKQKAVKRTSSKQASELHHAECFTGSGISNLAEDCQLRSHKAHWKIKRSAHNALMKSSYDLMRDKKYMFLCMLDFLPRAKVEKMTRPAQILCEDGDSSGQLFHKPLDFTRRIIPALLDAMGFGCTSDSSGRENMKIRHMKGKKPSQSANSVRDFIRFQITVAKQDEEIVHGIIHCNIMEEVSLAFRLCAHFVIRSCAGLKSRKNIKSGQAKKVDEVMTNAIFTLIVSLRGLFLDLLRDIQTTGATEETLSSNAVTQNIYSFFTCHSVETFTRAELLLMDCVHLLLDVSAGQGGLSEKKCKIFVENMLKLDGNRRKEKDSVDCQIHSGLMELLFRQLLQQEPDCSNAPIIKYLETLQSRNKVTSGALACTLASMSMPCRDTLERALTLRRQQKNLIDDAVTKASSPQKEITSPNMISTPRLRSSPKAIKNVNTLRFDGCFFLSSVIAFLTEPNGDDKKLQSDRSLKIRKLEQIAFFLFHRLVDIDLDNNCVKALSVQREDNISSAVLASLLLGSKILDIAVSMRRLLMMAEQASAPCNKGRNPAPCRKLIKKFEFRIMASLGFDGYKYSDLPISSIDTIGDLLSLNEDCRAELRHLHQHVGYTYSNLCLLDNPDMVCLAVYHFGSERLDLLQKSPRIFEVLDDDEQRLLELLSGHMMSIYKYTQARNQASPHAASNFLFENSLDPPDPAQLMTDIRIMSAFE